MRFIKIIVLITSLTFLYCTKTKDAQPAQPELKSTDLKSGFPDNPGSINGYFYAAARNNGNNFSVIAYAILSDPARDLISTYNHNNESMMFNSNNFGNINIGNVLFNNNSVNLFNTGNSVSYNSNNGNLTLTSINQAHWKTSGNGSFKAIDMDITRGFPILPNTFTNTSQTYSLSISNGFGLDISGASNYDSLIVSISNGASSFAQGARKNIAAGVTSVYFSSSDLSILSTGTYAYLYINAYNYSNKTVENVSYVFELANKVQTYLLVNP